MPTRLEMHPGHFFGVLGAGAQHALGRRGLPTFLALAKGCSTLQLSRICKKNDSHQKREHWKLCRLLRLANKLKWPGAQSNWIWLGQRHTGTALAAASKLPRGSCYLTLANSCQLQSLSDICPCLDDCIRRDIDGRPAKLRTKSDVPRG